MIITIEKPIPCLNTIYKTSRHNHIYKSSKAKEFCEYIKQNFKQEKLIETSIKMKIDFYINRDCDIDAKLKVALDSLNNVVYIDDKQIFQLNIKKILVKSKNEVKTVIELVEI